MIKTIAAEKIRLRNAYEKGTRCGCCGQHVKLYKRQPTHSQMIGLINLFKLNALSPGFYHVEKLGGFRTICDFPKLKHFGLIVKGENSDKAKKTSGTWKITQLGIDFVLENKSIPAAVYLYLDTVRKKSEKKIYIRQAIKKKFDYEELMRGV